MMGVVKSDLAAYEIRTLLVLMATARERETVEFGISRESLARRAGCTATRVSKATQRLQKGGWITKRPQGIRPSLFKLNFDYEELF